MPGYGGSRVLLDGALTHTFDETRPLLYGLAWLAALLILVTATYRRSVVTQHPNQMSKADNATSRERQPQ